MHVGHIATAKDLGKAAENKQSDCGNIDHVRDGSRCYWLKSWTGIMVHLTMVIVLYRYILYNLSHGKLKYIKEIFRVIIMQDTAIIPLECWTERYNDITVLFD